VDRERIHVPVSGGSSILSYSRLASRPAQHRRPTRRGAVLDRLDRWWGVERLEVASSGNNRSCSPPPLLARPARVPSSTVDNF
jgi:hypothetical protein